MAGDLGGWFRRLLGKGSRNGGGNGNVNGNGGAAPSLVAERAQVPASRLSDRETSAIAIQEGIRGLSDLLKGIEVRLRAQNEHGDRVSGQLDLLAETFRSVPSHGEKNAAILEAIRSEVQRQGAMGQEVAGYFRSLPGILETLQKGGTVRQAHLDVARGLVQEIASQGRRLAAFQQGAAELTGAVRTLSTVGEEQLACLKGIDSGIRSATEEQARSKVQWSRRVRRTTLAGLSVLGVGFLLLGSGIAASIALTHGLLDEVRAAVRNPFPAILMDGPVAPAPAAGSPAETAPAPTPPDPALGSGQEALGSDLPAAVEDESSPGEGPAPSTEETGADGPIPDEMHPFELDPATWSLWLP